MEAYAQENGYTWGKVAEEESGETDDTESVESYPDTASIGDTGRSTTPDISSPGSSILTPDASPPNPNIRPHRLSILALMEKLKR